MWQLLGLRHIIWGCSNLGEKGCQLLQSTSHRGVQLFWRVGKWQPLISTFSPLSAPTKALYVIMCPNWSASTCFSLSPIPHTFFRKPWSHASSKLQRTDRQTNGLSEWLRRVKCRATSAAKNLFPITVLSTSRVFVCMVLRDLTAPWRP